MNIKLINKLKRIEVQIESCMDAIENSLSKIEEESLHKELDKLMRDKSKIEKKIRRKSQDWA